MIRQTAATCVAVLCAVASAGAQPLTAPNNSAGTVMDTPPLLAPPAASGGESSRTGAPLTELPSRTDSAAWAFDKLNGTRNGYVTPGDVARLPGRASFDSADRNRDGRLDIDEFQRYWTDYQGAAK